jgi:hypothetical protein
MCDACFTTQKPMSEERSAFFKLAKFLYGAKLTQKCVCPHCDHWRHDTAKQRQACGFAHTWAVPDVGSVMEGLASTTEEGDMSKVVIQHRVQGWAQLPVDRWRVEWTKLWDLRLQHLNKLLSGEAAGAPPSDKYDDVLVRTHVVKRKKRRHAKRQAAAAQAVEIFLKEGGDATRVSARLVEQRALRKKLVDDGLKGVKAVGAYNEDDWCLDSGSDSEKSESVSDDSDYYESE